MTRHFIARAWVGAFASAVLAAGAMLIQPAGFLEAQEEPPVQWQRAEGPTEPPPLVFRSTQGINFPTATTLSKGEWQFEVSHRFRPAMSEGSDALWGLDGPVYLRLGLGYAITDRFTVTLQRSNEQDNLDLNFRGRLWERGHDRFPFLLGAQVGAAWNGELPDVSPEPDPWQFYAMVILDQGLGERVGIGLVPAYLRNPDVFAESPENAYSLGVHGQVYLSDDWSLLGEWNFSDAWNERLYDWGAFGVELEAGGHFFKLVVTNATSTNPSQFLAGTPFKFEPEEWRLGFNITRMF